MKSCWFLASFFILFQSFLGTIFLCFCGVVASQESLWATKTKTLISHLPLIFLFLLSSLNLPNSFPSSFIKPDKKSTFSSTIIPINQQNQQLNQHHSHQLVLFLYPVSKIKACCFLFSLLLSIMDAEFWTSRLAAAKRQFQHQHHLSDRLNMDDYEVEEEIRQDIPCPYCYEDFDIASLCNHLEDEHGTESKATICPICSVKVSRDLLSHLTLQHGHLFKLQRRRRLRRVALPTSQALSLLGRDLREAHLQVLLGGSGYRSSSASTTASVVTDPFLSSLVLNYSGSDQVDDFSKSLASASDDVPSAKNSLSPRPWKPSFDASLSGEERERRIRRATGKAGFMQDLLLCTLIGDQ